MEAVPARGAGDLHDDAVPPGASATGTCTGGRGAGEVAPLVDEGAVHETRADIGVPTDTR